MRISNFLKKGTALVLIAALLVSILLPPFAEAKQYSSNIKQFQLREMSDSMKSRAGQQAVLEKYGISPHQSIFKQTLEIPNYFQSILAQEFSGFRNKFEAIVEIIFNSIFNTFYEVQDSFFTLYQDSLSSIRQNFLPRPFGFELLGASILPIKRFNFSSKHRIEHLHKMEGKGGRGFKGLFGFFKSIVKKETPLPFGVPLWMLQALEVQSEDLEEALRIREVQGMVEQLARALKEDESKIIDVWKYVNEHTSSGEEKVGNLWTPQALLSLQTEVREGKTSPNQLIAALLLDTLQKPSLANTAAKILAGSMDRRNFIKGAAAFSSQALAMLHGGSSPSVIRSILDVNPLDPNQSLNITNPQFSYMLEFISKLHTRGIPLVFSPQELARFKKKLRDGKPITISEFPSKMPNLHMGGGSFANPNDWPALSESYLITLLEDEALYRVGFGKDFFKEIDLQVARRIERLEAINKRWLDLPSKSDAERYILNKLFGSSGKLVIPRTIKDMTDLVSLQQSRIDNMHNVGYWADDIIKTFILPQLTTNPLGQDKTKEINSDPDQTNKESAQSQQDDMTNPDQDSIDSEIVLEETDQETEEDLWMPRDFPLPQEIASLPADSSEARDFVHSYMQGDFFQVFNSLRNAKEKRLEEEMGVSASRLEPHVYWVAQVLAVKGYGNRSSGFAPMVNSERQIDLDSDASVILWHSIDFWTYQPTSEEIQIIESVPEAIYDASRNGIFVSAEGKTLGKIKSIFDEVAKKLPDHRVRGVPQNPNGIGASHNFGVNGGIPVGFFTLRDWFIRTELAQFLRLVIDKNYEVWAPENIPFLEGLRESKEFLDAVNKFFDAFVLPNPYHLHFWTERVMEIFTAVYFEEENYTAYVFMPSILLSDFLRLNASMDTPQSLLRGAEDPDTINDTIETNPQIIYHHEAIVLYTIHLMRRMFLMEPSPLQELLPDFKRFALAFMPGCELDFELLDPYSIRMKVHWLGEVIDFDLYLSILSSKIEDKEKKQPLFVGATTLLPQHRPGTPDLDPVKGPFDIVIPKFLLKEHRGSLFLNLAEEIEERMAQLRTWNHAKIDPTEIWITDYEQREKQSLQALANIDYAYRAFDNLEFGSNDSDLAIFEQIQSIFPEILSRLRETQLTLNKNDIPMKNDLGADMGEISEAQIVQEAERLIGLSSKIRQERFRSLTLMEHFRDGVSEMILKLYPYAWFKELLKGGLSLIEKIIQFKGTPRFFVRFLRTILSFTTGQYIAGANVDQALQGMKNSKPILSIADILGEATSTQEEAAANAQSCMELLEKMAAAGLEPNISTKVTALTLTELLDSPDEAKRKEGFDLAVQNYKKIMVKAREVRKKYSLKSTMVWIDKEEYIYRDVANQVIQTVLQELENEEDPNLRISKENGKPIPDFGVVVQAYFVDSLAEVEGLISWMDKYNLPFAIRLVKGAYHDQEVEVAKENGIPVPVWEEPWETDENYLEILRLLMKNHPFIQRIGIASHDVRTMVSGLLLAKTLNVEPDHIEFQSLFGMTENLKRALQQLTPYRIYAYVPFVFNGEIEKGIRYLMRRFDENSKANAANDNVTLAEIGKLAIDQLIKSKKFLVIPLLIATLVGKPAYGQEMVVQSSFWNHRLGTEYYLYKKELNSGKVISAKRLNDVSGSRTGNGKIIEKILSDDGKYVAVLYEYKAATMEGRRYIYHYFSIYDLDGNSVFHFGTTDFEGALKGIKITSLQFNKGLLTIHYQERQAAKRGEVSLKSFKDVPVRLGRSVKPDRSLDDPPGSALENPIYRAYLTKEKEIIIPPHFKLQMGGPLFVSTPLPEQDEFAYKDFVPSLKIFLMATGGYYAILWYSSIYRNENILKYDPIALFLPPALLFGATVVNFIAAPVPEVKSPKPQSEPASESVPVALTPLPLGRRAKKKTPNSEKSGQPSQFMDENLLSDESISRGRKDVLKWRNMEEVEPRDNRGSFVVGKVLSNGVFPFPKGFELSVGVKHFGKNVIGFLEKDINHGVILKWYELEHKKIVGPLLNVHYFDKDQIVMLKQGYVYDRTLGWLDILRWVEGKRIKPRENRESFFITKLNPNGAALIKYDSSLPWSGMLSVGTKYAYKNVIGILEEDLTHGVVLKWYLEENGKAKGDLINVHYFKDGEIQTLNKSKSEGRTLGWLDVLNWLDGKQTNIRENKASFFKSKASNEYGQVFAPNKKLLSVGAAYRGRDVIGILEPNANYGTVLSFYLLDEHKEKPVGNPIKIFGFQNKKLISIFPTKEVLVRKDNNRGGNWVWFKDLFFPHLSQEEYSLKKAWLEDVVSYVGVSLLVIPVVYLATGNFQIAQQVSFFTGIFVFMQWHGKWVAEIFGSRAPPEHLKAAETISWINFFAGVFSIIFPALMPFTFAVPFFTHHFKNRQTNSIKETIQLIQKHTEPSILYKLAFGLTKFVLSLNALDQNSVIVVQLDKFVKIKGEDIRVPKAFEEVLKGIVGAIEEQPRNQKPNIVFVLNSSRHEDIANTLSKELHIPYLFSSDTPKNARKEIEEKRKLEILFVLTRNQDPWEGVTRLTLGKLLGGLGRGFEMKVEGELAKALESMGQEFDWLSSDRIIRREGQLILRQMNFMSEPLKNLWQEQVYRIQA